MAIDRVAFLRWHVMHSPDLLGTGAGIFAQLSRENDRQAHRWQLTHCVAQRKTSALRPTLGIAKTLAERRRNRHRRRPIRTPPMDPKAARNENGIKKQRETGEHRWADDGWLGHLLASPPAVGSGDGTCDFIYGVLFCWPCFPRRLEIRLGQVQWPHDGRFAARSPFSVISDERSALETTATTTATATTLSSSLSTAAA